MTLRNYEGMFLLNSSQESETQAAKQAIDHLIGRLGGEIVHRKSWGDRRLIYEIAKHKKAYYELLFFKLDPARVSELRRDLDLSEHVIRNLILAHDEARFLALIEKAKIEEVKPSETTPPTSPEEDRERKRRFPDEYELEGAEREGRARSAGEAVS